MSLSFTEAQYLGGPQVFPTNFALGILEVSHIEVTSLTKVDGLGNPLVYTFSYNASNTDVTVLTPLDMNEFIRIARVVPKDELFVNFETSDITPRNVDNTVKQALMAVHEVVDQEEVNRDLANEALDAVAVLNQNIAGQVLTATNAAADALVSRTLSASNAAASLTSANQSEASRLASSTSAAASLASQNAASGSATQALGFRNDTQTLRDATLVLRDQTFASTADALLWRDRAESAAGSAQFNADAAVTNKIATDIARDVAIAARDVAAQEADDAAASAAIALTAQQALSRNTFVSTALPTAGDGVNGDIWFQY